MKNEYKRSDLYPDVLWRINFRNPAYYTIDLKIPKKTDKERKKEIRIYYKEKAEKWVRESKEGCNLLFRI